MNDFARGFAEGFREAGRVRSGRRAWPALAVALGGAIAIYALVRMAA